MKRVIYLVFLFLSMNVLAAENDSSQVESDWIVSYQFALYFLTDPEQDPVVNAKNIIKKEFPGFIIVDEFRKKPETPTLSITHIPDVQSRYQPPDIKSIGYFGKGISKDQAERVQLSKNALVVNFVYPIKYVLSSQYEALQLMGVLSRHNQSLIWDEETREIFSADAWREIRIDSWEQGVPSVKDQTVIHAYKNTEYVRAISLGMAKFGFPDIVVNDFSWSNNRSMGNLINLVAQSFVEGNLFDDAMALEMDISQIQHSGVRAPMLSTLLENASPNVKLFFKISKPEEGDPDNSLVEITFDHISGESLQVKQDLLTSALFGSEDNLSYVRHNNEILAASERAKKNLPMLRVNFNKGLEPGEYINLKSPFKTPSGENEWMWVEVINWHGNRIIGLLKNEPFNVPNLKAGSEVEINQNDVFDYIRYYADGREEGNETGLLIQKYSQN